MDPLWLLASLLGLAVIALMLFVAFLQRLLRETRRAMEREVSERTAAVLRDAKEWRLAGERYRLIFDWASQIIGLLASDGKVLEANGTFLYLAGVGRDDVVGRKIWETPSYARDPALSDRVREAVSRAAARERVGTEIELQTPDGLPLPILFSLTPLLDDRGCVEFLLLEGANNSNQGRAQ